MPLSELVRLVLTGLRASRFSFASNVIATAVGLTFFGTLLALTTGVGQFLERYYTRTVALTTLTVYQPADRTDAEPFDQAYRQRLADRPGIRQVVYHELGFVEIGIAQGRMTTVCLRSAVADDPEIERLERVAGTNLPTTPEPIQPSLVLPLNVVQRLSDLPPAELIGTEVALVMDRSLNLEDPNQHATLYGKIAGIVNESPENSVYVDYSVMALISPWKRERDLDHSEEPSDSHAALTNTPDEAETKVETKAESTHHKQTKTGFAYATLRDAWEAIQEQIAQDTLIYPSLRLHVQDLETVTALRQQFRKAGLPSDSILDDVATIRDLRHYGLLIGALIGAITLIAATCSIFNTVLASVERRTAEIGILRAIGASTPQVIGIFLLEGIFVALVGAAVTCGVLWIGTDLANEWLLQQLTKNPDYEHLASLKPMLFLFTPTLGLFVVAVGGLVALLASLFPAWLAARLAPADALRQR